MKRILLVFALVSLAVSGYSLDWGGNLEDSTYYHYSDSTSAGSKFFHADTLGFWLRTGLWKDTELFAQGSYTYTTENPYFFDIDSLRIENRTSSFLQYTLGRFTLSDFSGYIFSHKLDGGFVSLNFPWGVVKAEAGYTGLLFHRSSSIKMSLADQADTDGLFDLASPRLVGGGGVLLPDLYLLQDVNIEGWVQFDLRPENELTKENDPTPLIINSSIRGGKLDSQYFGVKVSGSVIPSLYQNSFVYLGTGRTLSYIGGKYTYKPILSFLGSVGLRYYMESFLHSRIGFQFLYSSGDSDYSSSFLEGNTEGNGTNFIPISRKSLALVFSPQLGNIFFTSLSYSVKPDVLKNFQFELKDVNYFRSTAGQISESGIDPSSSSLYLGTEVDGTVNYRPFSDLGLSLSSGVFIPNNGSGGAFLASQRKVEVLARLGLSFSF